MQETRKKIDSNKQQEEIADSRILVVVLSNPAAEVWVNCCSPKRQVLVWASSEQKAEEAVDSVVNIPQISGCRKGVHKHWSDEMVVEWAADSRPGEPSCACRVVGRE